MFMYVTITQSTNSTRYKLVKKRNFQFYLPDAAVILKFNPAHGKGVDMVSWLEVTIMQSANLVRQKLTIPSNT